MISTLNGKVRERVSNPSFYGVDINSIEPTSFELHVIYRNHHDMLVMRNERFDDVC